MHRRPLTRPLRPRRRALLGAAFAPAVLSVVLAVPAGADATGARRVVVPAAAIDPEPSSGTAVRSVDALAGHVTAPRTHRVVAGETLSGIAARYGVGVDALAATNGLADPDLVIAGTTLALPTGLVEAPPAASTGGAGADLPARLQASPERLALLPTFDRWAAANGIPADLLKAMTWLESGWQNDRVSSTGAMGIGQLMPDTVTFVEQLIGRDLDPAVAEDNIRMAARYLRWLLAHHATIGDALAAYYQGPASLARHGRFSDTEQYVADVLALRSRF